MKKEVHPGRDIFVAKNLVGYIDHDPPLSARFIFFKDSIFILSVLFRSRGLFPAAYTLHFLRVKVLFFFLFDDLDFINLKEKF